MSKRKFNFRHFPRKKKKNKNKKKKKKKNENVAKIKVTMIRVGIWYNVLANFCN